MVYRRLARAIGVRPELVDVETIDGADIDDPSGIRWRRGLLEQVKQGLSKEEWALDIDIHDLVPAALWKFLDRRAPGRACIIYQDVELRLA